MDRTLMLRHFDEKHFARGSPKPANPREIDLARNELRKFRFAEKGKVTVTRNGLVKAGLPDRVELYSDKTNRVFIRFSLDTVEGKALRIEMPVEEALMWRLFPVFMRMTTQSKLYLLLEEYDQKAELERIA